MPDPSPIQAALDGAIAAIRGGRPGEAQRLAAQALDLDPGQAVAQKVLGHALLMQGRFAEAVDALERATEQDEDASAETLLAKALAGAGRREEALEAARRATRRRPPFPMAFVELGEQLGDLRRFDEAAEAMLAGLELAPEAVVLRIGLGHLHLKRNDRGAARALFQQAHAAAPDRPDAMIALAKVASMEGDYAGAAELYREALRRQPADAVTRIQLGKCLLETGRRQEGEAALRTAVKDAPELEGVALTALASTPHGRLFLKPARAREFLRP